MYGDLDFVSNELLVVSCPARNLACFCAIDRVEDLRMTAFKSAAKRSIAGLTNKRQFPP